MRQLAGLIFAFALTACATLTADADQEINVATTPPGAACVLSNGEGSWSIASTPGSAMVKRAFSPLLVRCDKAGTKGAGQIIEAETRGRAYGNILLLGIPAIVDSATGDGYVYNPDGVSLTLEPTAK